MVPLMDRRYLQEESDQDLNYPPNQQAREKTHYIKSQFTHSITFWHPQHLGKTANDIAVIPATSTPSGNT